MDWMEAGLSIRRCTLARRRFMALGGAAIELGDVDRHEETHDGIARGATGSVEDDDVGGGLRSRCHDVSQ